MENELRARLDNLMPKLPGPAHIPENLLVITTLTLEAIRDHILETHSVREGEVIIADTAIELVKDYRDKE